MGKLARPRRIVWADDLPKTRSGKIMRRLLRDPDVMKRLEGKIQEEQASEVSQGA
jgi:acetyl-CoA synthetase